MTSISDLRVHQRKQQFAYCSSIAVIDKLTENAYIKGLTKRQCTTIKRAFIKNYSYTDDKPNSVSPPQIEVETWTPKPKGN